MRLSMLTLAEGALLPRGYGVAWHEPAAQVAVCLPVPLNIVAGAFRAWWLRLRRPYASDLIAEAYRAGLAAGQRGAMKELFRRLDAAEETFRKHAARPD